MNTKLKLTALFTFVLFAVAFFAPKGETQTQVETAGQKFKSIKVLNDMPADQMGKVMNMMSASLGVDCKFCHASNDADYEKEGFEHKDMARTMLKMTFDLNKNFFNGRPEINCNTCHKGISHPQPSFPLAPATPPVPRPAQPATKPTIDELLAKYEESLGGKANLAKVTSRHIKAQRLEPDGKTTEAEEVWTKGFKTIAQTTYGNYVVSEIYDGTNAMKLGNKEKLDLKADELEQIKRDAQVFANPNLKAIYPTMDVRFLEKLDGKDVWLILATTADKKRERIYLDANTGLLVRRVATSPTVLGNFAYQVDYADYKDFGGVKVPTTIKFAVPHIYWTRKVLEVKNNVTIDDAKFKF
ncbi:MAG: c-type cytochrome [Acidobacteriota bacterium]